MHSDMLSAHVHASHGLHPELKKRILAQQRVGLTVLDWGCGRGSDVLHLRQSGTEAFGADISQDTIDRGKSLFDDRGFHHAAIIKRISTENETEFPSAAFDIIVSYQVLEHVEDLASAAREMHRLLKPGGFSVHLYPAHRRPIEGHLHMPLVHWLPKNRLRFLSIRAFTALGIEPQWPELQGIASAQRAERYHEFSVNRTFYRKPGEVIRTFETAGLIANFEARLHERVVRSPLAKLPQRPLEWLLTTFAGCVLIARKPGN